MSTSSELLTPDRAPHGGGKPAWATALRQREHELGLGCPGLTVFQREAWREVYADQLTPEERATAPRSRSVQRNQRGRG
jgi:hypothetical protein